MKKLIAICAVLFATASVCFAQDAVKSSAQKSDAQQNEVKITSENQTVSSKPVTNESTSTVQQESAKPCAHDASKTCTKQEGASKGCCSKTTTAPATKEASTSETKPEQPAPEPFKTSKPAKSTK